MDRWKRGDAEWIMKNLPHGTHKEFTEILAKRCGYGFSYADRQDLHPEIVGEYAFQIDITYLDAFNGVESLYVLGLVNRCPDVTNVFEYLKKLIGADIGRGFNTLAKKLSAEAGISDGIPSLSEKEIFPRDILQKVKGLTQEQREELYQAQFTN